jgi:hypothetical protein
MCISIKDGVQYKYIREGIKSIKVAEYPSFLVLLFIL